MKHILIFFCLLSAFLAGGQGFDLLNIPANARTAGLGGYAVSNGDKDIAMILNNPALMDSVQSGSFDLMVNPYFADVMRYSAVSAMKLPVLGALGVGIVFLNYGDFQRTDDIGTDLGQFNSNEYLIQATKSHSAGPFTLGLTAKFAHSRLDALSASALLMDFGGIYSHPETSLKIGMVIRNLGLVLSEYAGTSGSDLPFDVQIGTTFKPQYMPVRFTFTVFDITNSSRMYHAVKEEIDQLDKVFRHVNLGGAFIIGDYIEVLAGYNQKRRQELRLSESAYGAGFSWGLLLKIREIQLRFSRSAFHAAGGTSFFSLQSNVKSIKKIF